MATELVVTTNEKGLQIAVLEDGKLVELQRDIGTSQFEVGDIYLGRVTRLRPSMKAAFVDVGHGKDGFLHYTDLGPQIRTQDKFLRQLLNSRGEVPDIESFDPEIDIDKNGNITDALKPNQVVLVVIMKEAISSKGPRLASDLYIAGQYIIFKPFSNEINISRKIRNNREKRDMKKFLSGVMPRNCGVIVRTAAEGVDFKELEEELKRLYAKFQAMLKEIIAARPPKKVLSEMDRTSTLMRDMLSTGFERIYTDSPQAHADIDKYLTENLPDKRKVLQLKQHRMGLFEHYGVDRQIKSTFGKTVNLNNGAYVVIEHTEALHTIDVNSGSLKVNTDDPEVAATRINLDAAKEIARQLRLRDMGGIIVVDFIDMKRHENRRAVHNMLRDEMEKDRAKHAILPMSRFGLIEITRQRVRPEVKIETDETCPNCNGTGKQRPSILLHEEILNNVDYLIKKGNNKSLKLVCNPYVASYFKQGLFGQQWKWLRKYGKWIKVQEDNAMGFMEVKYVGANDEEIKLD